MVAQDCTRCRLLRSFVIARDGIMGTKAAMALGADVIERHFTIEGADDARDGPVSITPAHMQELSDFSSLSLQERKMLWIVIILVGK